MKVFSNFISYLLHPLFIPVGGTVAYLLITPKFTPLEIQSASILPIFILTVIIPIITFLILRNLGLINSMSLESVQERKYPLYIHASILLLILYKVIPYNHIAELYFYFAGLLGATIACILLLFFNFKTSLHNVGISSLLMYLINLSIHFEINLIMAISLFIVLTGCVMTARLYLKTHTLLEVITGLFIGLLSQLLTIRFWL